MGNPGIPTQVRLAAVGDILLTTDPKGLALPRPALGAFAPLRPLFAASDLVVGNLECTVPGSAKTLPTEPRVVATPAMVRAVREVGFHVVSLANNHIFDCLEDGFHRVRALLGELGMRYFGAGDNLLEAAAPAIVEVRGLRVAFLGAADERSGCPRFAAADRAGVAPLDVDRLTRQIRELRGEADHIIVSLHWGEERFLIPSPVQMRQAHALAEAGASLILGHHPHVIQGLEQHGGVPIVYSLGNCLACDVFFTDGDRLTWNRTERTGGLLQADLSAGGVSNVRVQATYDDGRVVGLETSGFGDRRIARANRALARGVTPARYRREYFWVKTVLPALGHLKWSKMKRLRPTQVRRFLKVLSQALRAR